MCGQDRAFYGNGNARQSAVLARLPGEAVGEGMEFQIRVAQVADAGGIARVKVEGWKTTYRGIVPDGYLDAMDVEPQARAFAAQLGTGGSLTLVAEDEAGAIVGFVSGGPVRERCWGYDSELYAIYLLKSWQAQGLGSALVRELLAGLKARGFQAMVIWALEANPAVGFYKRLGARAISGKITVIDGERIPEVLLGLVFQGAGDRARGKATAEAKA